MSVLIQNKGPLKISIKKGMALVQYGNMLPVIGKMKPKIHWLGKHAVRVIIETSNLGFKIQGMDEKINPTNVRYLDKGVYLDPDNQLYVRFFRPKTVPEFIIPLTSEKISPVKTKISPKKKKISKLNPQLVDLLLGFANNINKNYGVFTDSEVNIKQYVEDYIRKDIKGQNFDVEKATTKFKKFMETKALPAVEKAEKHKIKTPKKEHKKHKVRFTQKEYDLWFESGRKGPLVNDLRDILRKRGIKNVTSKTTKKDMKTIVKKRVR